jgi:hypothetical protein
MQQPPQSQQGQQGQQQVYAIPQSALQPGTLVRTGSEPARHLPVCRFDFSPFSFIYAAQPGQQVYAYPAQQGGVVNGSPVTYVPYYQPQQNTRM